MITYRQANIGDLRQIANVHIQCFPDDFVSSLGIELVFNLYLAYLEKNSPFIVAEDEENNIAGFCAGTIDGSRVKEFFEHTNKYKLAIKILCKCFKFEKETLKRVKQKIKSALKHRKKSISTNNVPQGSDIASICILEHYRGKNIASDLLAEYENLIRKHNIDKIYINVKKNNSRAISFLEKSGFTISNTYNNGIGYIKQL